MKRAYAFSLFIIAAITGCREEYDAKIVSAQEAYLVVEANLNAAADSTVIRLTRSFMLEQSARLRTDNNALVTVEGRDNTTRILTGTGNGYYVSPNLNLTIGTEYRLRIKTAGKEYVSEYVKARLTPAIDSISWEVNNEGLRIYANTHDPSRASKYYLWNYDETWEIRSRYYSNYIYDAGIDNVRPRNFPAEEVFYCWKYDTSSSIFLANSTRLQEDVIYKAPLQFIPAGSEKLSVRYSIKVRQYALDKNAYNFYELMKKNTEEVGSLFSAQPFELKGNISCLNEPDEYVLGYVTVSSMDVKRIFIHYTWPWIQQCSDDLYVNETNRDSIRLYFNNGGFTPFEYDLITHSYHYSENECVDCRSRGGSLKRPSFW